VLLAAVTLPLLLTILYRFEPTEDSIYPRCAFHALTGLHCPGCGTTRCLHALLHGDVRQAAAFNLLTLLSLPPLVVWGLRAGLAALRGTTVRGPRLPAWSILALFGLVVAFWVLRNTGLPPFDLLAPHRLEGNSGPPPAGSRPEPGPGGGPVPPAARAGASVSAGSTRNVGTLEPRPALTLRSGSVASGAPSRQRSLMS
jgi:hypothetical protein